MALLALSGWATLERRSPRPSPRAAPPLATLSELALPGAALAVSLDLEGLRKNLWGQAALEQLLPLAGSSAECTRAALAQVERITLTIPAEGSTSSAPDLAVLAEGQRLRAAPVLACATEVLREQGGEPQPSRLADFERLRSRSGQSELAVRDGGPLIVSGDRFVRALLEPRRERATPTARETLHRALRSELGPAPLVLSWTLPPGWLERWLEDPEVARSPLADVRALAIRGDIAEEVSLRGLVLTESEQAAQRIEAFLRSTRTELAPLLDASLGPGQSERLQITRKARQVELSLRISTRLLVASWGALSRAREPRSHALGGAHAQEPEPEPERAPRRPAHQQP